MFFYTLDVSPRNYSTTNSWQLGRSLTGFPSFYGYFFRLYYLMTDEHDGLRRGPCRRHRATARHPRPHVHGQFCQIFLSIKLSRYLFLIFFFSVSPDDVVFPNIIIITHSNLSFVFYAGLQDVRCGDTDGSDPRKNVAGSPLAPLVPLLMPQHAPESTKAPFAATRRRSKRPRRRRRRGGESRVSVLGRRDATVAEN